MNEKTENRGESLPLPGDLVYEPRGGYLYDGAIPAADVRHRDDEGLIRMRGWGHLTGTGGLNMSDREAATYQDRLGAEMALRWNSHAALREALSLMVSVVKSGEKWSSTCEEVVSRAFAKTSDSAP